jgi:uncharacterized protein
MTLKEKIQNDFIEAMKSKNNVVKTTLSGLKAKITEADKVNGVEVSDDEILKIIIKSIKQLEESIKIYIDANRSDLAVKESEEKLVLKTYLPQEMTEDEIESAIREIVLGLPTLPSLNATIGRTLGEFNKKYQGRADAKSVLNIISKVVI